MFLEQRVAFEAGALLAASPLLLGFIGRGDASPVLVLPGFTADDVSTVALRYHLRTWGYWAHGWHLGANLGPTPRRLQALRARLDAVHERHGRKVVVIGQSAGGLYARHLARLEPDKVRQVITLGSPLQMRTGDETSISALVRRLEARFDPEFFRLADHERGCLPVPSTSIFTRTDGVVRWHVCLDVADDEHENIEVYATHSGLAVNPAALHVIADRLRQPEGEWRPYRPPAFARRLYPRTKGWDNERSVGRYRHRPRPSVVVGDVLSEAADETWAADGP